MKTTTFRFILPWSLFATAGMQVGFAQSAQITGRITDSTDAVIPGASVTVTNEDTGLQYKLESNEGG